MPRKPTARDELKLLSTRVLVNVKRGITTTTPITVWQHEIPLLHEVHGEDNVTIVDPKVMDEGYKAKVAPELLPFNKRQDLIQRPSESIGLGYVFIGSAEVEYQRLVNAYGKHPEVDALVVERVYGRFQDGRFADMLGEPTKADLPAAQLIELIKQHGYLPEIGYDATKEEKDAAAKARADLHAKPQPALVAICDEMAIEID